MKKDNHASASCVAEKKRKYNSEGWSHNEKLKLWQAYVFVSFVAISVYINGLEGDFVHDDIPAVTLNGDVLASSPIGDIFKNDFWGMPMARADSHKSYRPLTVLTFRLNFLCSGLQPLWFHITNVLLHAVASLLFTMVSLKIARLDKSLALFAGMFFAVHPIHTEAVTGIVGRADVLASIFFLFSLLAYHGTESDEPHIWSSIICGGLGMLAKETGITVLLLNITYDLYLNWSHLKRSIENKGLNLESSSFCYRLICVVIFSIIFLAARLAILHGSLPKFGEQDNPAAFHPSLCVRFLTFSYLTAFNGYLLIYPLNLSHDWQMGSIPLVTSIYDSKNFLTCFFFGMIVLLSVKCLMDFETQKRGPLVLALLLLICPFIPASNLLFTVGFVVAERVLYMPSMGFILLIVYGIKELMQNYSKQKQIVLCLMVMLLAGGVVRTVLRNRNWRSREALLRAGLKTLPQNAKMHYNYGNFLKDGSKFELARIYYDTAIRLWPRYASAHNNLGTILMNATEAESHFLTTILISQNHLNAHYNLGKLYRKNNRTLESEKMLTKCLDIDPTFTMAHLELVKLKKSSTVSTLFFKKVVGRNPKNVFYVTLFKILRKIGQKDIIFQMITRWYVINKPLMDIMPGRFNVDLSDWSPKDDDIKGNRFSYFITSYKNITLTSPESFHCKYKNLASVGEARHFLPAVFGDVIDNV